MKARMIPLVLVSVLALALGAFTVACGGDDDGGGGGSGKELTLEEYFQELQKLTSDFDQRGQEAEAAFEEKFDSLDAEDDLISMTVDFMSELTPIVSDFVDELDALNPPPEVKDAHEKAVEDGRAALKDFEDTLEKVGDTDDPAEIEKILSESTFAGSGDSTDEFGQSCNDLQAVADENSIDVDLQCDGGSAEE